MGNFKSILFGAVAALAMIQPAFADPTPSETSAQAAPAPAQPEATPETQATPEATSTPDAVAPAAAADDPVLGVARSKLAAAKASDDEREKMDQTALTEFYAARHGDGLWVTASGVKPETKALITEIENANAYGLDASAFKLPMLENGALTATDTDTLADAEIQYSTAALQYARFARGGRIPDPAEMLTTEFDRRPQWIDPATVIKALADSHEPDAYLRSLHPQQPQFEKLRQLYVTMLPANGNLAKLSPAAKRLRANMEMWRWMWPDMGDFYVLNNIPEFMQYVYKDGEIIRSAKIVAGEVDKKSTIFSRPLKYVVLRPAWRVPESIMVNELWPSLIRGGGLMRQYGLQLQTKDGRRVDWRQYDWSSTDIRNFIVLQPPGPKSVLGRVKFSFPSQHTIFMHDTPDKWMFRPAQRTLSHGCLRVQNPMQLAEMVLKEDKGWDAAKIAELDRSGPLNNEVPISKEIPIHLVYFTAWVTDDGKLKTFNDVYGHEKRVTLALDGQWSKIKKGRNHLAPVEPSFNPAAVASKSRGRDTATATRRSAQTNATLGDIIGSAFGL
ncbi:ErfK/YbiS/YcfS/YnhG family protein [Hyphomicrobium denitrificans ATCC 51888]|uniref:ErfK/YbiS/YcfS/YnhG family protein n=1 Tax=Hyphomicrobium denitrificans (strain ATCC 51888 / DSM 1869 / NCIMB 11706 / TK 0415) TaxID=582899 RepID=D8JXI9_HYPDA|nr:L,D-transpeptidase family protein [Hyphomicrobium denitrificans]ADJ25170.1 ErfK/YbiS/YcfS/YnhG family protein [Hyphomicrobium denitrificans ATCC 51888]